MPPRSIIETLPGELRDELNRRLLASGYGDLEGQAEWLRAQGVQIGKSAVGEYSKGLKASMEKALTRARTRVEAAKALGGLGDGDKAALLEANEMVLLDKLMDIMDEWDGEAWAGGGEEGGDGKPVLAKKSAALAQLIRAASDLGGSARGTAKWRREFEAQVRGEERARAEQAATQAATKAGVTAEGIAAIRAAIAARM